ncbi:MAG TPA: alpha/beta fold hydrolase [Gemmatimonadaceae bacterium]
MSARVSSTLALFIAFPAFAQSGLQGNWQGSWIREGSSLAVTFSFQQVNDSTITGSLGADQLRAIGIPLSKISYRPPAVHFEIVGDATTAMFDGVLAGDSISGKVKDGSAEGQFVIRRAPGLAANPYRTEEISFQNGDVKLAGSLLIPSDGKQKHPAMLFLQGSGPEGRYANRFLGDLVARQGVAALIYDKRGVGGSTGNWRNSTFSDLAQDAIAGVEFLRNRTDIDPRRIGIYGHSQGATIAPLVASQSPAVSFVIASAASGLPAAEVERYSLRNSLGRDVLTADETREAHRYVDLVVESGRLGYRTAALDSAIARDSTAKWFFAAPPNDNYYWKFSKQIADYNAATYWRNVHVPVLFLYGEKDQRVPVKESVRNIEAALKAANNRRYTIRIFPNANHTLRVASTGSSFAWPSNPPGYLETLRQWVSEVTRSTSPR